MFFFSSRRRHTRSDRDWSSDVCSSDRSEEHTSELQSRSDLVCRLLLVTGVQTCALPIDRKSTRLNSSHDQISYAVFCLKKKKKTRPDTRRRNSAHPLLSLSIARQETSSGPSAPPPPPIHMWNGAATRARI